MTARILKKTFDIAEDPWWRPKYCNPEDVNSLLERIIYLRKVTKEELTVDDPYWEGYVNVHHTEYLLECITGENNDTDLTYRDVENILSAGYLRLAWNFLFNRKKYRTIIKVKNLDNAVKILFPNICLLEPFPLNNLNIEFVRKLHQQVGKYVIPNAGKFRTRDAKPAQETFFYLAPNLIESRLKKLFGECQEVFADPDLPLLDVVKYGACFLAEFLYIHPFSNGNGRVGRLLLSCLLAKYTIVPLSLYSSNSSRDVYLQCLRESREPYPEANKPASLSRFILENIEREFNKLHYRMAWNVISV